MKPAAGTSGTPSDGGTTTTDVAPPDAIQVAFLPGFLGAMRDPEQENFLGPDQFPVAETKPTGQGLSFELLRQDYNATDVPVKILETVGTLIQAAGNIAKQQLNPAAAIRWGWCGPLPFAPEQKYWTFYIKMEQVIEPVTGFRNRGSEWRQRRPTDLAFVRWRACSRTLAWSSSEVRSVITKDQFCE